MARGIEHRSPESLLTSFEFYKMIKWAIYAGQEQVICYDGDNEEDSLDLLTNTLNAIKESGNNTTYTLRLYADTVNSIDKKSPPKGSTTFLFGGAPVKWENGIVVVDRESKQQQYQNAFPRPDAAAAETIKALQAQLETERELRHKAELNNLRTEFDNKISGLQDNKQEDIWDRVIPLAEKALDKPDGIEKVFIGLGSLLDKFMNKGQTPAPHPAINGTDKKDTMQEHENQEETDIEEETELTPEEQILFDRMDDAIEKIEQKVGTVPLVEALEKLSVMDAGKLQALLAMM